MKNVSLLILPLLLISCSHTRKGDNALPLRATAQVPSSPSLEQSSYKADAPLIPEGRSCFTRIFEGEIVTGAGLTYEDAQMDLHKKLPMVGVLQAVNLEQTKISAGSSYSETSIMRNKISANIDTMVTQNCKINGLFAISVMLPENSINYIPKSVSELIDVSEEATFAYASKACGNDQYSVLVSMNDDFDISEGRIVSQKRERGVHKLVVCGQFKLKSSWNPQHGWSTDIREIFANKYNLIYLGSVRTKDIRDYSREFHLEMIKNAIAKK